MVPKKRSIPECEQGSELRPRRDSGRPFFWAAAFVVLANGALFAQQPHVAAPNKPVPPNLITPRPLPPAVEQSMVGGPWITDANYHSVLVIKNNVKTTSIKVQPILYIANGHSYPLQEVTIDGAGVTTIDINQALAKQGIAPWAALSGYVELQYEWPWDALCATIVNSDSIHSEVFTAKFRSTIIEEGTSIHQGPAHSDASPTTTVLEGMWWKQETNVMGFVAISNVSSHPLSIRLDVSDRAGDPIVNHELTVSSHATKIVQLPELLSATTPDGGMRATFAGQTSDVLIGGGLQDSLTGYSADLTFEPSLSAPSTTASNQYAMLGLMAGAADPMLKFPAGTVFTPYANVRNISKQNVLVTPVIWWMEGAAPRSARLSQVTVLPFHSTSLDVPAMLSAAGLQKFTGSINLVLEMTGPLHSLLIASGSVDKKNTYVFSVPPGATRESVAKSLSYWSTANGDDTMVTLWNPADDPQDFTFTLFFSGGQYDLPVHLDGRVSRAFNISEIVNNQIPDSHGRTIPITVHEGSAEVAGSKGANQHIMVALAAGTYNVVKATCVWHCVTCQGAVSGAVSAGTVAIGDSVQLTFTIYNHDGSQFDDTRNAIWTSSDNSVATIAGNSFGLINGVSPRNTTITANDPGVQDYAARLCAYGEYPDCGSVVGQQNNATVIVVNAPGYMVVLDVEVSTCNGCVSTVQQEVTYNVRYSDGTSVGVIPICETVNLSNNTCGQTFTPQTNTCGTNNGSTDGGGSFIDRWTLNSDNFSPGCGVNITDTWRWYQSASYKPPFGTLTGYVHTDAIQTNGYTVPPQTNGMPSNLRINP